MITQHPTFVGRFRCTFFGSLLFLVAALGLPACSSAPVQSGEEQTTGGGGSGGPSSVTAESLQNAVQSSLTVGDDVAWMGDNDTQFVASAVLEASVQATGGQSFRFYGTLTQVSNEQFSYSESPQDKLVVVSSSGQTIEIIIHKLDGYVQGTMDDFLNSHDMDYNLFSNDVVDIHVQSSAVPNGNDVQKRLVVQGKAKTDDGWLDIDMTRSRQQHEEVDYDWAKLQRTDDYTGTISGPAGTVHLQERDGFTYQAYKGTHARNFSVESHSSFELAGRSFGLQDMYVQWEDATVFNGGRNEDQNRTIIVSEPDYWQARGSLMEGNQLVGNIGFSAPVVAGSKGPDVVLSLQDGAVVQVFRPIQRP